MLTIFSLCIANKFNREFYWIISCEKLNFNTAKVKVMVIRISHKYTYYLYLKYVFYLIYLNEPLILDSQDLAFDPH